MGYQSFKELKVWQEAKNLAVKIYELTNSGKFKRDFSLKEQIQKSAVSVPSNIAEGYERNSNKDFIRFLLIAKGSLSELRTQLQIAYEVGYIKENEFVEVDEWCKKISAMITRLIKSRSTSK